MKEKINNILSVILIVGVVGLILFASIEFGIESKSEENYSESSLYNDMKIEELEEENEKLMSCIEDLHETRKNAMDSLESIYSLDVEYGDYIPYDIIRSYPKQAGQYLYDAPVNCPLN